jgi:hypothetical protein
VVRTDQYSWGSPVTLITLAIAAALLAAFVYTERATAAEPLVRLACSPTAQFAGNHNIRPQQG